MELTLTRKYLRDEYTIGTLDINGVHFSETLEDKVRVLDDKNGDGDFSDEGEGKIYGKTAIPCGRYRVTIAFWKKHKKFIPLLHDVPGYSGILIHSGATAKDTLGCILTGENKIKGGLIKGKEYSEKLTEIIRTALRKEEVWITITQP